MTTAPQHPILHNLPNAITFGRLLAVPLAVWLILDRQLDWAFWLFVAAGISDALDGMIARLCSARTVLGGYLDPLADKALLVCVYITLGHEGYVPLWLVILVVFRDAMIVGAILLLYTLRESLVMEPLFISKLNTLAQIALAATVLAIHGLAIADPQPVAGIPLSSLLLWLVTATTAISGISYFVQGTRLFARHSGRP